MLAQYVYCDLWCCGVVVVVVWRYHTSNQSNETCQCGNVMVQMMTNDMQQFHCMIGYAVVVAVAVGWWW